MLETVLVLLVTTLGNITLELEPAKAPVTVNNFVAYVESGHYNGTQFHRVINGFMVQGGGFDANLQQKPTRPPILNEADNGLQNRRGTIAMARTGEPHSATAQFFINTVDNTPLDFRGRNPQGWGYTVFGRVVEGMDVVDRIEKVRTGTKLIQGYPAQDVPVETVLIKEARVLRKPGADAGAGKKAAPAKATP